MENKRSDHDAEMLRDIYKDCRMGAGSTVKLAGNTENESMRQLMNGQLKQYQGFAARASDLLAERGQTPEDASFFEKLPAEIGMAVGQMTDPSDSKTAQMMINGFVMGIAELKKQLADSPDVSEQTAALCADMIQFQLGAMHDMEQYL